MLSEALENIFPLLTERENNRKQKTIENTVCFNLYFRKHSVF